MRNIEAVSRAEVVQAAFAREAYSLKTLPLRSHTHMSVSDLSGCATMNDEC